MITGVEIVDSTAQHARLLAQNLREKDKQEAIALGLDPVKALFNQYRIACYRKTALIDGKVVAMWGLCGTLLATKGQPYLVTSTDIEKISSFRFFRVYVQEVQNMVRLFPQLSNYVDASYHEAIRVLKLAGFQVSKPFCYGPDDKLFREFSLSV